MPRNGLKWTYFDDDVLAAWVAEMDFGLASPVTEALHNAVDDGLTGYPFPDLEQSTAKAATRFFTTRFDWDVSPEMVFSAPDVIEGLRRAIVHLTRPDSPVILHSPVYFPFYSMVERAGRDVIEVQCSPDADGVFRLNLDAIDRALDDGAGSIVLCDPWNPTGRAFTPDELGAIVTLAARHDARILADAIHQGLTYPGVSHTPVASLDAERTVTVTSASKAWNIPGLKCAQVVLTSESDRQIWSDYFTPEKVGVSTFGLIANEAAYRGGGSWLESTRARLDSNRTVFNVLIDQFLPEAAYRPPEATYLAWLDLSAYEVVEPAEFLLEEARVGVTAGRPFGTGADQHIRFNFATDPEVISEAVERMAGALKR